MMRPAILAAALASLLSPTVTAAADGRSLGKAEVDSAALTAALENVRYDPPFVAEVEALTGRFDALVKLGYLIFNDTRRYAPTYVRNGLNCRNCHVQVGAQANAAPLWGAFPNYPDYRSKNHLVNAYANRLQGCFLYSMNGLAPPPNGEVIQGLAAYSAWMSQGLPVGVSLDGRGYAEVTDFAAPDADRGARLYAVQCAICHGADGQGVRVRGGGPGYQFPPLWGPDSYSAGAGMHRHRHFRNFVKATMPLGQGGTLSDQDAADLAAFVNQPAHARPTRINDPGQAPDF